MLKYSGRGQEVGGERESLAWYRQRDGGAGICKGGTDGESGERSGEGREKIVITIGYVLEYGGFYG